MNDDLGIRDFQRELVHRMFFGIVRAVYVPEWYVWVRYQGFDIPSSTFPG